MAEGRSWWTRSSLSVSSEPHPKTALTRIGPTVFRKKKKMGEKPPILSHRQVPSGLALDSEEGWRESGNILPIFSQSISCFLTPLRSYHLYLESSFCCRFLLNWKVSLGWREHHHRKFRVSSICFSTMWEALVSFSFPSSFTFYPKEKPKQPMVVRKRV